MPGAPNRPPATTPESPAAIPGEEAGRAVLRRLAPMRVALLLDTWKGAPSPELLIPLERAEAAFPAGDWSGAQSHLDQLSVRFAEPRWPTLPAPFRELRVSIPPPQPPQWDPDHGITPEEKGARKLKRDADRQVALARASITWLGKKGISTADLEPLLAGADQTLAATGPVPELWHGLDQLWAQLYARLPAVRGAGPPRPAPPTDAA